MEGLLKTSGGTSGYSDCPVIMSPSICSLLLIDKVIIKYTKTCIENIKNL